MEADLDTLAAQAQAGSRDALETLVTHTQGYIYNLAIRMLRNPPDAEDATQEALIRIITNLGQFRGESAFLTWAYRVASNVLVNVWQRDGRRTAYSFEAMSDQIDRSLHVYGQSVEETVADAALSEEVRRSCTLGMLLCLDHEDRLALILGELIGVDGETGAAIMGLRPDAYRKRLSRARQALVAFVSARCGLVNPANPCRCPKHVQNKIRAGALNPNAHAYPTPHDAASESALSDALDPALEQGMRALALLRAHPEYASRTDFGQMVRNLFDGDDEPPR